MLARTFLRHCWSDAAPANLNCRHIWGCRGDLRDGLHYADKNDVLIVAGHTLVLHNLELRTQRFITFSPEAEQITAVAVSPVRKLLAVAERAEKSTVTVYDLQTLKRRKVVATGGEGRPKVTLPPVHSQPATTCS